MNHSVCFSWLWTLAFWKWNSEAMNWKVQCLYFKAALPANSQISTTFHGRGIAHLERVKTQVSAHPPHPHPPFQILLQKVEDRAQETCISGKFPGGAEAVGPGTPLENHGSEELADRCLTRSGEACLRYLCFSWPQTRHLPTLNLFPTWKLNIIIPALLPAQVCTCSRCMGGK